MKNSFKTKSAVFLALLILSSCASQSSRFACPSFGSNSNKTVKNKIFKQRLNLPNVRKVLSFKNRTKPNKPRVFNQLSKEKQLTGFENPIASVKNEPSMELEKQNSLYESDSENIYPIEKQVNRILKDQKTNNSIGNIKTPNEQNQEIEIVQISSNKEANEDVKPKNERKRAILKGVSLLLMALIAFISIPVLGTLTASIGLVAILLLDIFISFSLIKYYKNKQPKLAKTTGLSRLIYSAIFGIGIGYHIAGNVLMFNTFWQIGLIGFGLHLIALGILFNNEGGKKWVNIAIKSLLIVAGIQYIFLNAGLLLLPNLIAFEALKKSIFILPMILGEISFAFWMIFKGGKKNKLQ